MTNNIETILAENRLFEAPANFVNNANLQKSQLKRMYQQAEANNSKFWSDLAKENLDWIKPFTKSLNDSNPPFFKWFEDGTLNVSYNCIDRHLVNKGNKIAIIFEGEKGDVTTYTFTQLHKEVCKFANVLLQQGVNKGDRVIIYMPMNAHALIAMQACARIGAIHSVVFGGFSSQALRDRVVDAKAKIVITADGAQRGGKVVQLKTMVDAALNESGHDVKKVIVQRRSKEVVNMEHGRDLYWDEVEQGVSTENQPAEMNAEDTLFLLYTSGSTGKPKGIVHSSAGYLLNTMLTCKWVFDLKNDDVFWCTADVGWITGHSYVVYGPLALGKTIVIYEGVPTVPDTGRFWKMSQDHKVTVFYTAPTAIRALMKNGDEIPNKYDLSALRLLGTVGEPINPEAWIWYHKVIGKEKCPIVDTWWQTETGANMIAPIPGVVALKPGSCTLPLPGIDAQIIDDEGNALGNDSGGNLVIRKPWPSMLRGIWGDPERYKKTYFPKSAHGYYLVGDSAYKDEDGYIWILGRIDDVLNVSGHRLGTMEIESALVSHEKIAEAAVVGKKDDIKGEAVVAFCVVKGEVPQGNDKEALVQELRNWVTKEIGPIAKPDTIKFGSNLPKTRSGKIMRRLLRVLANGEKITQDTSTLEDPNILKQFVD